MPEKSETPIQDRIDRDKKPTTGELRDTRKITPPGPADFLRPEGPPYHRPGVALPVEQKPKEEEQK